MTRGRSFAASLALSTPLLAPALGAQSLHGLRPHAGAGWQIDAEAGSGYESNVRFQGEDDAGDIVRRLRIGASGTWRAGRTLMAINAAGDGASYQTLSDLDRITYQTGFDVSRAATQRLSLFGGVLARRSQSPDVTQNGVTLPLAQLARSDTYGGAAGLAYRVAPRANLTIDGSYSDTHYDASSIGAGLSGGTTTTGEAELDHRPSTTSSIGLRYRIELTQLAGSDYTTHVASGDWAFALGPFGVRARGGVTLLRTMASDSVVPAAPTVVRPVGDMSVEHRRGDVRASITGARTVAPTLGIGRVLSTDRVGAALERTGRASIVRLGVDQTWSGDPNDAALRLRTTIASADLRQRIGATGAWVTLGAFERRRSSITEIASQGVTLGVGTVVGH